MADKDDDDLIVNIDDLDTVTVDVGDSATTPKEVVAEAKTPKESKTRRVKLGDDGQVVLTPSPEEALAQAQTYAKQQEEARKAAEATAANERAQREQAQRDAQQARQEAEQSLQRATSSELINIENGIAAAQREIEAHEAEYTRAAEAGEFAKMGTIQTKLSRAAAKLDRLEDQKASFDVTAATTRGQTTEGRVEAPTIQPNVVEQYLSQFSPTAQNWLRQHPECMDVRAGGDATKNSLMMAGHWAAKAKLLTEGTPEYFKVIEEHIAPPVQQRQEIDPKVASKAADIQEAGTTRTQRQVQPSAPVTRDPPSGGGTPRNVREVRLTKDQQEMAKVSFPHLPEAQAYGQYARNLIELEAEGKIGRSTH